MKKTIIKNGKYLLADFERKTQKPFKTGGSLLSDGNGEVILMTAMEAFKFSKRHCSKADRLSNFYLNDYDEYWTFSAN